ncbi:hypothetical protein EOE67_09550 [Rheinheimera riviphila]|uniref:Uncharacterized protein n=1 Tax=Rheinheimera riviphila TaxID=1834037 RepID=A0A437QT76_9GAMM|nr:hypothetical protein [Rheinheimera riviphila]RVU37705.1 hypothetical protein EOE67_09550 [Rheinheimera riviphila]
MKNIVQTGLLVLMSVTINSAAAAEISADFIKAEIEVAYSQYKTGTPETGIYALETLGRLLKSADSAALQAEIGPNNLPLTYIRIGLLHEKAGDTTKATAFFNQAAELLKDEKVDIAQLKQKVFQLDSKQH